MQIIYNNNNINMQVMFHNNYEIIFTVIKSFKIISKDFIIKFITYSMYEITPRYEIPFYTLLYFVVACGYLIP